MKRERILSTEQIEDLLQTAQVCTVCTLDEDGGPYAVPVQFLWQNGKLYFHGARKGNKADNIRRDARVCVNIYEEAGLCYQEDAAYMCNISTNFRSAVLRGTVAEVTDEAEKTERLRALVRKYVPGMEQKPVKQATFDYTSVFAVTPAEVTGKYYGSKYGNE